MRALFARSGLLLATALLCSCGEPLPPDRELRAAFQEAYPDAQIVKIVYDGEDASTAYIRFHYRTPGDDTVRETMWQFTDSGEGKKKRVLIPPQKA